MSRRRQPLFSLGRTLWLMTSAGLLVAVVYLAYSGHAQALHLKPANLWPQLFKPLARALAFIAVGLFVAQLMEGLGWTRRLGRWLSPLLAFARLPEHLMTSFTTSFVSGVTANTILVTAYQEKSIDRRQVYLGNLLNSSLPSYTLHFMSTAFIAIPLVGRAGVIYLLLTLVAAIIRLLAVAVACRLMLPAPPPDATAGEPPARPTFKHVLEVTKQKFAQRVMRMGMVVVPVFVSVFLLARLGLFGYLEKLMGGWMAGVFPVQAMSVVIVTLATDYASGFAATGGLLGSGALTEAQAVLAILAGNLCSTPVRALRHQAPYYMGIFSPGMGLWLMALSQAARFTSVLLVTVAYWWWAF